MKDVAGSASPPHPSSVATHTPGPWLAAAGPSSIVGWPIVAQQGRAICGITWPRGLPRGSLSDEFYRECVANAHLIAAAPDLLAALKQIKRDNQQYNFGGRLVRIVDAAIAKAEGR